MKIKFSLVAAFFLLMLSPFGAHAASTDTLSGYAWSSNVGWVSFNCTNDNSCGTNNYGVTVASNGTITGYAWSPNVGWISFNSADTTGCPSGTCQATFNKSSGTVTGWARAVAGEDTNTADTGGWAGWIHLSSTASPSYGVTANGCAWGGYAWGGGPDTYSGDIGWLKFSGSNYGVVAATNSAGCGSYPPVVASCSVDPSSIYQSQSTTWKATATGGDGTNYSYSWSGTGGLTGTNASQSYQYSSPGTYTGSVYVSSASGAATTTQACTTGGAGDTNGAASVTVQSCTPSYSASPTSVTLGQSTTLSYSVPNAACANSCTFSDGGSAAVPVLTGTHTVTPPAPTSGSTDSYSITCGTGNYSATTNVNVILPGASIVATPTRVATGETTQVSWSATNVNSCTVTKNGVTFATPTVVAHNVASSTPVTDNPTTQTTYTITCATNGNNAVSSTIVNVVPQFNEF